MDGAEHGHLRAGRAGSEIMTRARLMAGWGVIAGVTAICFLLDRQQMLHSHFNAYMAILLAVSAILVGGICSICRAGDSSERDLNQQQEKTRGNAVREDQSRSGETRK
jgi:hypothetical protein